MWGFPVSALRASVRHGAVYDLSPTGKLLRWCPGCDQYFPFTRRHFRVRQTRLGLAVPCKTCFNDYQSVQAKRRRRTLQGAAYRPRRRGWRPMLDSEE